MKRIVYLLAVLLLATLDSLHAAEAAKPVNPDTWIKAETDHADATYKCGTQALAGKAIGPKPAARLPLPPKPAAPAGASGLRPSK